MENVVNDSTSIESFNSIEYKNKNKDKRKL